MSKEAASDQEFEMVKKLAFALGEHFDAVQIMVSRHEPDKGGTHFINYGVGNWFSRYGQAKEWLVKQDAINADEARKNHEP
jgi:hypothetical protein